MKTKLTMKTKIFAVIALIGVISFGAISFAGAQATSTTATTTATSSDSGHGKPIKLPGNKIEISPSGEANIVGSVVSTSGNFISIQSWGGTWSVAIATDTVVAGVGVRGDVSQIKIGDIVGVHGKMSAGSNLILQAKVIKDFSLVKNSSETKKEAKEVKKEIKDNDREEIRDKKLNFWNRIKEFLQDKKHNSTSSKEL